MWLFRSGLVLFIYIAINVYTGIRSWALIKYFLPSFKALVFWPLYILLCYSFILISVSGLDRIRPLRQAAMYTLPAFVYFFLTLLILDAVRICLRLLNVIPPSRIFPAAGTGIALFLTILLMIYGGFHARDIRTAHYSVTLDKNMGAPPLRLALVSDLHIGTSVDRKWTAAIVNAVNEAKPDIVCLAGDIFDNDLSIIKDLDGVAEELKRLKAPLGVYACQGNHDSDRRSLRENATTDRIQNFLKNAGVIYLLDEVVLVQDRFYLAGRMDARPIGLRQARKSASELVAGLDSSLPLIFLDHQPVDFPAEEEAGADLILAGHTHRGQFFPGSIATAVIYKKAGAVDYGLWRGKSAQGIVSSGAGVWGPVIRIATNSEVAVIDVRFGN